MDIHIVLTGNGILLRRLTGVGVLEAERVTRYSLTGVIARGAGVPYDERHSGYGAYGACSFSTAVGKCGDSLERYLLRLHEIVNSGRIVQQLVPFLLCGSGRGDLKIIPTHYGRIEEMIHAFKLQSEGVVLPTYSRRNAIAVECPKGIYAAIAESDANNPDRPQRFAVIPNDFLAVSYLAKYTRNISLPDLIAVLGSIDFVLGSVDKRLSIASLSLGKGLDYNDVPRSTTG